MSISAAGHLPAEVHLQIARELVRERNSAGTLGAVSSLDRSYYVRTTPLLYEELRLLENRELGAFIQSLNSVEERVTGTGVELLSLIKRIEIGLMDPNRSALANITLLYIPCHPLLSFSSLTHLIFCGCNIPFEFLPTLLSPYDPRLRSQLVQLSLRDCQVLQLDAGLKYIFQFVDRFPNPHQPKPTRKTSMGQFYKWLPGGTAAFGKMLQKDKAIVEAKYSDEMYHTLENCASAPLDYDTTQDLEDGRAVVPFARLEVMELLTFGISYSTIVDGIFAGTLFPRLEKLAVLHEATYDPNWGAPTDFDELNPEDNESCFLSLSRSLSLREGDSRQVPGKLSLDLDTDTTRSRGRRPGWTLRDANIAPLSSEDEAKAEEEYGAYVGPRLQELLVTEY